MGLLIAQCFWLAGPVAIAGILHMVAVKKGVWPSLAIPIDGGRTWRGQAIFGPNKTWRGVVFMIASAAALGGVQGLLGGSWAEESGVAVVSGGDGAASWAVAYAALNAVFGLGYALGELPNSFLKRRIGIVAGKTGSGFIGGLFFLLDQADSVVAALLLGKAFAGFPWAVVWMGSLCLSLLHLIINGSLYVARIRKNL